MNSDKKNGFGVASMVLGIIAICFSFIPLISYLSFILGILSIIFAIVSFCQKSSKGFAITGLLVAIVALVIAYGMHNGLKNAVNTVSNAVNDLGNVITDANESENDNTKATLDKFNQIETGMTYEEVVGIMGEEGTLSTESSYGSQSLKTYYWYASNGYSNATISFMNNKVSAKSQIGLK